MRVKLDFNFSSQSDIDKIAGLCNASESQVRHILDLTEIEIPCRPIIEDKIYIRDFADYFPPEEEEVVLKMVDVRFIVKSVIIERDHLLCICLLN